jgi:hypothetical protein
VITIILDFNLVIVLVNVTTSISVQGSLYMRTLHCTGSKQQLTGGVPGTLQGTEAKINCVTLAALDPPFEDNCYAIDVNTNAIPTEVGAPTKPAPPLSFAVQSCSAVH